MEGQWPFTGLCLPPINACIGMPLAYAQSGATHTNEQKWSWLEAHESEHTTTFFFFLSRGDRLLKGNGTAESKFVPAMGISGDFKFLVTPEAR